MKLLLDENLAPRLAEFLAEDFPGTIHVEQILNRRATDRVIWALASREGYAVVTKDVDFYKRAESAEDGCKVIWIRIGNCSTRQVSSLLRCNLRRISDFLQSEERCLPLNDL